MYTYVCINDIITGQLLAREDTKESSHEPFQALWRPLHKCTDESHANLQQTWHYFRSKFVLGPSLKRPIFSNY